MGHFASPSVNIFGFTTGKKVIGVRERTYCTEQNAASDAAVSGSNEAMHMAEDCYYNAEQQQQHQQQRVISPKDYR